MQQLKQMIKEEFNRFLSGTGLKATLQRNLILNAFIGLNRHTHVDELYLTLRAQHTGIGHATVYRALRLFAESGLASEVNFGDGITRYELARKGGRHDYLVCSDCGTVTGFENSSTEQRQNEVALSLGFYLSLKIELRGVCSRCLPEGQSLEKAHCQS